MLVSRHIVTSLGLGQRVTTRGLGQNQCRRVGPLFRIESLGMRLDHSGPEVCRYYRGKGVGEARGGEQGREGGGQGRRNVDA